LGIASIVPSSLLSDSSAAFAGSASFSASAIGLSRQLIDSEHSISLYLYTLSHADIPRHGGTEKATTKVPIELIFHSLEL
jgi:hypothetical protein